MLLLFAVRSFSLNIFFLSGDELISQLEFRSNWQGWDALVLIGMILFYRTLAYFALRFVRPKQEAY